MHIVTSYRPEITTGAAMLHKESRGLLLISVYFAGIAAGGSVYQLSEPLRSLTQRIFIDWLLNDISLSGLALLSLIAVVGTATSLFGAGLSMIGSFYVYVTAAVMGSFSGVFFLSVYVSDVSMAAVRHGIAAIPVSLCVAMLLLMGEYASLMSGEIKNDRRSRGDDEQKKYALRQIILSLSAGIAAFLSALTVVLLRHVN